VVVDPSLSSLVLSSGVLTPAFSSALTTYSLTAPPGVTSVTVTASVAYPTHATIVVGGLSVGSGVASAAQAIGLLPSTLQVVVTAEGGQTKSYSVTLNRAPPTYFKANNARMPSPSTEIAPTTPPPMRGPSSLTRGARANHLPRRARRCWQRPPAR